MVITLYFIDSMKFSFLFNNAMQEKNLFSICKQFASVISTIGFTTKSIHTNCSRNITISSSSLSPQVYTEESVLVSKFISILQSCSDASALRLGQQVHAQIFVNGFFTEKMDLAFGSRILSMYVLCKSFTDAKNTFFWLLEFCPHSSPLPWNWMIRGFTMMGWFQFALLFYFKMLSCSVSPDKYTFPYIIKACSGLSALNSGRLIHENICSRGLEMDIFVGSSLIKMYAESDSIDDARIVFDKIPVKDCVLWNVMLNGYARNGDSEKALGLFKNMRFTEIKPNSVTFACVLSLCASQAMLEYGTQLHGLVVRCGLDLDSSVTNTLLAMYSKCRCLYDARRLFNMMMPRTDLVTWNGMISGFVQNGFMSEAWDLFHEMLSSGVKPDSITFASFLPSVSHLASLRWGKEIHAYIVRNGVCLDAFLMSALIDIYFKCGGIDIACKIFDRTETVDVVICTAMISGYVLNGMNNRALEILRWLLGAQMRPTPVTLASVLPACAGLASLKLGKELHSYILKNGHEGSCYVGSAVMDMYAKCGRLDLSHQIFGRMFERDSVAWNSMITSCSQNGKPEEAISLFRQMVFGGTKYDCVTISAALSACADFPALRYGKEIHGVMMKDNLRSDLFTESALIDMYAKCGDLVFARRVFDLMEGKNEVSWNSMIAAYGTHGCINEALDLFEKMLGNRIQPDHITFLAIISGCGHAGLVDEGFHYFRVMTEDYGIMARMEHYACMVDLFGRAGRLGEALNIIKSKPFDADAGIWGALLGACRIHGDVEIAEIASKHLFELDPQNSGYYVLLANVHADAGQWDSVLKVRSLMKERGVQKLAGCSWIDINSTTHMFVAADTSHPQSSQIYPLLKSLLLEMRKIGYVPQPYLPVYSQAQLG